MNFNKAEFVRSYGEYSQLPPSDRLELAFAGRSNVGKSSLINKIFNRKNLARVSAVPGKTATINYYSLENIYLVDLPGYGYAKVAKSDKVRWSGLIDMRHPPTADDMQMINFLIESEIPFVIIFTKADKLSKRQREERMAGFAQEIPYFSDIEHVEFSAENGEGADKIRNIICELAESGNDDIG